MASRILLELDANSARMAVARGGLRAWEIVDSFAIDLDSPGNSGKCVEQIRTAMLARSVPLRGDLDLIVSRRDIELRELGLPPAPENELPEMVRFVARSEFTHFGDGTPLDFSPIRGGADSAWTVVAATLNQNPAKLAGELAAGLNLKLRRILVRPWCVAHAVSHGIRPEQVTLVIDGGGESVEMSLWHQGHMLVARSFRPGSQEAAAREQEIADEIQRTLMVAGRATDGRAVDELVAIGSEQDFPLPKRIGFPPHRHVHPGSHRSGAGAGSARGQAFAAHRGALNQLERPLGDMLDFQNPRRALQRQFNWRKAGGWAAAAAGLLLMVLFYVWSVLAGQSAEMAEKRGQLAELQKANAPSPDRKWPGTEQVTGETKVIDEWVAGQVSWLEELQQVSNRMLTPDDAMVDSMLLSLDGQKALIQLKGHVLDVETGTDIKTNLGSRPFAVIPGNTKTDSRSRDYPLTFEYDLTRDLDPSAAVQKIADLARAAARQASGKPAGEATSPPEANPAGGDPAAPASGGS